VTLFGVPDKVWCRSYDERGIGLDEAFEMQLLYPPQPGSKTPLAVYLGASILSPSKKQTRYLVKGLNGNFHKYGLDPQEPFLRAGKKVRDAGFGIEEKEAWGTLELCRDGNWTEEP